jgi:hypothetical protein
MKKLHHKAELKFNARIKSGLQFLYKFNLKKKFFTLEEADLEANKIWFRVSLN